MRVPPAFEIVAGGVILRWWMLPNRNIKDSMLLCCHPEGNRHCMCEGPKNQQLYAVGTQVDEILENVYLIFDG